MVTSIARKPRNWSLIVLCVSAVLATLFAAVGVYLLAGCGWAMLTLALPFAALAAVMLRGIVNAE